MGGFAVPERALTQGDPPILAPPGPAPEPGGYALVPARLLSQVAGRAGQLPAVAVLVWAIAVLEYQPDAAGGGVRLRQNDLADRLQLGGTRMIANALQLLEDGGWLKSVRGPRGKRYWPQRLVDPHKPSRPGWYATISRADLARIGQPLDPTNPDAGTVARRDLVAWARWQGIVRGDQVRIDYTQIAARFGLSVRAAKTTTHRLMRGGWLAVDAEPSQPGIYRRAGATPAAARDFASAAEAVQKSADQSCRKMQVHSSLSASTRNLPPSPPTEPDSSPAGPAATREGWTSSKTTATTTTDEESKPRPEGASTADEGVGESGTFLSVGSGETNTPPTLGAAAYPLADDVERVCDAVASAWPTPVGRPPIHRGRLKAKLAATAAVERLGAQLLIRHLTDNQGAVRDPLAVVLARLDALPPATPNRREPPWCGRCNSNVFRFAVVGHDGNGGEILAPCETCGGGTPKRTQLEISTATSPKRPAPAAAETPPNDSDVLTAATRAPRTGEGLSAALNGYLPTGDVAVTAPHRPTGHSAGYLAAMAALGRQEFVRPLEQMVRVGWRSAPRVSQDG